MSARVELLPSASRSIPKIAFRGVSKLRKSQIFFSVVLPAAVPQIFTGLKVAIALSWAAVVVAELVGAQEGLGFMISDATQIFRIPVVFIGIALIGLALNALLSGSEDRLVQ